MGKSAYEMKNVEQPAEIEGDENEERGNWSGKLDFLLSCIGYAVGLGNVWRFPYVAYQNGGGSFLFPYAIMLIFAGLPLFYLEMGLGQFASLGPISVWQVAPFFRGLGVAMVIISGLVCIYYNMIIAYTLYYFFASLNKEVPWMYCKPEWKELGCVDRELSENETLARNATKEWCNWLTDIHKNESIKEMHVNHSDYVSLDDSSYISNCTLTEKSPSLVYWEYEVLGMSNAINEGSSDFRWQLVLCLILAWIVIFFALIKGIKSSGKVVYVTATFPYIVLIILLIRNATLEGAKVGIDYYITPKWDELKSVKPWYAAAVQIFYSLGVAFGGLEVMASYNKFHNNVHRDSLIVAFTNCATSVFAGFVIFSVIGHMSVRIGTNVEDAATSGPGLAFVAYPEGIAMMPVAPLWAVLFFLMLFTLGLDSQFAMMETIITSIVDEFPWLRKGKRKMLFTLFLCVVLFLLGLPQCAANGIFIMELFNWYSAGFSLIIVSIFEIIAISYVYGFLRFRKDLQMMIGKGGLFKFIFWPYWFPTWVFITPALLVFVLVMYCREHAPITYPGYPDAYPAWADGLGWLMVAFAVFWIPVMAVVEYARHHNWLRTCKAVFTPEDDWGPAVPQYRTGIYASDITPPPEYTNYNDDGMDNPSFVEPGTAKF